MIDSFPPVFEQLESRRLLSVGPVLTTRQVHLLHVALVEHAARIAHVAQMQQAAHLARLAHIGRLAALSNADQLTLYYLENQPSADATQPNAPPQTSPSTDAVLNPPSQNTYSSGGGSAGAGTISSSLFSNAPVLG